MSLLTWPSPLALKGGDRREDTRDAGAKRLGCGWSAKRGTHLRCCSWSEKLRPAGRLAGEAQSPGGTTAGQGVDVTTFENGV